MVLKRFGQVRNFTPEQDKELLTWIDEQIVLRKCKIEDASAKMVQIEKKNLKQDPPPTAQAKKEIFRPSVKAHRQIVHHQILQYRVSGLPMPVRRVQIRKLRTVT